MMQVINRKSKQVTINNRRTEPKIFMSVAGIYVAFTTGAAEMCGINIESKIQFINDGADWSFFVDESEDGFHVIELQNKKSIRPSFRINSIGLVKMILKSTGFTDSKRFHIENTFRYHEGNPIYKLNA